MTLITIVERLVAILESLEWSPRDLEAFVVEEMEACQIAVPLHGYHILKNE